MKGLATLVVAVVMAKRYIVEAEALKSGSTNQVVTSPDKGNELKERAFVVGRRKLQVEIDSRDRGSTIEADMYTFVEPTGYVIGLLLDPCRNRGFDCCVDRFGEPAYVDPSASIAETFSLVDESGATLDTSVSRIGDRPSIFDPDCYMENNSIPFRLQKILRPNGLTVLKNYTNSGCIGRLRALTPIDEVERPACWDFNDSINALASCYDVDGRKRYKCVAVGFMQTSYIVQCGGAFRLSNHCGTFLELHEPGNDVVLSQTRLLGQYLSGFRTTTLSLLYQGDRTQTVCKGAYEIWWVQRTRSNFIIQKKKKFRITTPECDYDFTTNKYKNYHQIEKQ